MDNFFQYRYKAHWGFALQVFCGEESSRDLVRDGMFVTVLKQPA